MSENKELKVEEIKNISGGTDINSPLNTDEQNHPDNLTEQSPLNTGAIYGTRNQNGIFINEIFGKRPNFLRELGEEKSGKK